MNHQVQHANNSNDYSIKSLREQMAQLLVLREQVRQAEAERNKRFSIAEKNHQSKSGSMRPLYLVTQEREATAANSSYRWK